MKKRIMLHILALATLATGCADLNVVNQNDPDRDRALASANDVESLMSGAFQNWWSIAQYGYPSAALSVAADAHSSSWGNFGMRDSGWEPRKAHNNDPAYTYDEVNRIPWRDSYRALAAVRDGKLAIEGGLRIQEEGGPDNTDRAVLFGTFVQAMALSHLAILFDRAFIIDETVEDIATAELVDYGAIWAAAESKFGEVIQGAASGGFEIPSEWVGHNGSWSSSRFEEIARSYRARYRAQMPRTVAERDAVDWNSVLQDATAGISQTYAGYYERGGSFWAYSIMKYYVSNYPPWARTDYRTIGPADASGGWETWIAAGPNEKRPFAIDTDDRRITDGTPTSDGSYLEYLGRSPFPADRGVYHYSHYVDGRWHHILAANLEGEHPDMTPLELEFLAAEAAFRTGDKERAMATVNKYRTQNGKLPPFTNVNGPAPGGDRCVPQMADGSCGDLWEALKYEKRIELFSYAMGMEYFDDRGWGDLVRHTWLQLPIPGNELLLLLMDIYTFGGPGGSSAAPQKIAQEFMDDVSPEAIRAKLAALEAARTQSALDALLVPVRR